MPPDVTHIFRKQLRDSLVGKVPDEKLESVVDELMTLAKEQGERIKEQRLKDEAEASSEITPP